MDNIAMPVTIVVKAPNQQIEDQTVHCELNWTIKKLKGHLSEVYPSKPRLEDQKLIYSGQLLVDTVQLKDVLRTYDGQENHTVHLVCSPPRDISRSTNFNKHSTSTISSTNATNGSSYASFPSNDSSHSSSGSDSPSESVPLLQQFTPDGRQIGGDPREFWAAAAASASLPNFGVYDGSGIPPQMVWMQQVYSQYMNNYMQYLTSQRGSGNDGNFSPYGYMPPGVNSQFNLQNTQFYGPQYQQPPQQQQQAQQPNVAAANNQQQDDDEEGRGHRDWLDWFYIMSRVLVLFSIVYFYSSPVRFLMVSTLGMIMYLYQVGFFRMQGLEGRGDVGANNNRNPANVAAAERENNNDRPNPAAGNGENVNTNDADSNSAQPQDADAAPQPPEPDRPSFLTLTWTIFCSFLLSLIPEQPNVI